MRKTALNKSLIIVMLCTLIALLLAVFYSCFYGLKTVNAAENNNAGELVLKWKGSSWQINLNDFEVHSSIHTIEENASKFNRHKSIAEKLEMAGSLTKIVSLEKAFDLVFWKFNDSVNLIIEKIEKPAIDATIKFNLATETFFTTKEEVGYKINKEQFYLELFKELNNNKKLTVFNIKAEPIKPKFTQKELLKVNTKRCEFVTSYLSSGQERKHNIRLASSKFNGLRINPGEVLSFNNTTGKRSKENGYKQAKIISSGFFIEGFGGGVCQVSTTLFNALALSGLEIIEARSHSMPVSYVEKGQDAMVNEGTSDLKVKNNFKTPVFIKAEVIDNSSLIIKVFGEDLCDITYALESEIVETIPPLPPKLIIDTDKKFINIVEFKGERVCVHEGTEGFKTKTYLVKFKDGNQISRQVIRRDLYKPSATIIVEGAN